MFRGGNHGWDAQTVFSDDPFVLTDVTPCSCDDPNWDRGIVQEKIYRSIEALERITRTCWPNQPISHQPISPSATTSAIGPAQRDRVSTPASASSCVKGHQARPGLAGGGAVTAGSWRGCSSAEPELFSCG
jgi:hypothetical protein